MATTTIRMGDSVGYITITSPIEVKVSVTNPTRLVIPAHQVRASFGGIGASTSRAYKASYRLYNRLGDVAYYNVDSSKTGYVANASTNANVASFNTDAYIYAGSWFNSNNSTTRTIESALTLRVLQLEGYISSSSDPYDYIWLQNPVTVANVNVTLDAPPTFTASNVSFDTSYVYTGLTTASVDVSALSAKYGGSITEVKLTIGNQSVTRTDNGTLSILLESEGTFTPTVTVTDSRGQVTTKTLEAITVNGYTAPSAVFTAERTTSTGVDDDEGEYAVLDTNIAFTDVVADLTAPTVTIDGTPATVTWYSSRATDGTLSGTVNWSSLTSPATVYGLIDVPNIQTSYSVILTPNDTEGSGLPITQTIASAFYTIDFLAGGHGIAFGQPSSRDGFECNMPTTFHQDLVAQDMTTQEVSDFVDSLDVGGGDGIINFFYPVGSYYETSDTLFDPNTAWGGTWVLEANGESNITDSGWLTLVNTNGTIIYRKIGKTVFVDGYGLQITHNVIRATLPEGYRPDRRTTVAGAFPLTKQTYANIETNGTINPIINGGGTESQWYFQAVFSTGVGESSGINRWHRTA